MALTPESQAILERVLAGYGIPTTRGVVGAAGAALGGVAEAGAQARAGRQEMEMSREQLRQSGQANQTQAMLAREQERRASAADAWRRLQQAQHIATTTGKGPGVSPYSKPIQGPSDQMRAYASNPGFLELLENQSTGHNPFFGELNDGITRLELPGARYAKDVYGDMDRNSRPSWWEQISGLVSAGIGMLGGRR